ncbi:AfsR/SARP family transcriptional regulator [Actinophytocola sp. KF-1]
MDDALGILGTTALLVDGAPDDTWGRPRERAMLATLVVHAGEVVPVETLLRWVWPDDKPVPLNPAPTVHTYATRIRRALERMPSAPALHAVPGGYRLDVAQSRIDLGRFREQLSEAAFALADDPQQTVDRIDAALWWWRGLPAADLTSAPAQQWREHILRDVWLGAHTLRVRALLDLGRHDDAVAALTDLQADFPDDVVLAIMRLTALHGLRRYADATRYHLATWRRYRADGDEYAARQLQQHNASLKAAHPVPAVPVPTLVPRQLPPDVPVFTGRTAELAILDETGPGPGVVVVDGAGGVGKTALVVHWTHRARDRFPDGDVFVQLRGSSGTGQVETAAVVDAVLRALGQPPEPVLGRRQRERLLSLLVAGRRMVVVLDNARDTDQVRELVGLLHSCLVIVTSRQRLSMLAAETGARRITLGPVDSRTADDLLAVHAVRRGPAFDRVIDYCAGSPLLLTILGRELAGRSRGQVDEFVTHLDMRRLLTVNGSRGETTSNMEACFTTAYRALGAQERRLFRLLAIHPGMDISATAAYACDGRTPTETMRSLMALAGFHLVEQADELDRFRFHNLVAEFAGRCLERDEPLKGRRAAVSRLLDHYRTAATDAARLLCGYPGGATDSWGSFCDEADASAWFGRERTTLPALVRLGHDMACHDRVWSLAEPVALLFDLAGCHVESRMIRELAVDSANRNGDREAEAVAQHGLGITCLRLGDHGAARRWLEAAACSGDVERLRGGQASVLLHLGKLAVLRGDRAEAVDLYLRGAEAAEAAEDLEGLCWFKLRLGQVLRPVDPDAAMTHLWMAWEFARATGERSVEATILAELGATYRERGEADTAAARYEEALAVAEAVPDLTAAALICVALSEIRMEQRQFAKAVAHASNGVDLLRGTQEFAAQAVAVEALADALHNSGEPHAALSTWQEAMDLYDYTGSPGLIARLQEKIDKFRFPGRVPAARAEEPSGEAVVHRMSVIRLSRYRN